MNEELLLEHLADIENRLSYLEALNTPAFCSYDIPEEGKIIPGTGILEWTPKQWDYVKQLKSRTEWVEQKIYDLANKKAEDTYK